MVGSGGYSFEKAGEQSKNSSIDGESLVVETGGKFTKQQEAMTAVSPETNGNVYENGYSKENGVEKIKLDDAGSPTPSTMTSSDSGSDDGGEKKKKKEKKKAPPMVGVVELFRFATWRDRLLMLIGFIGSVAHGAAMPIMIIVFGDMTDLFVYQAKWINIANALAQNISESCAPMCGPTPVPPNFNLDGLATFCSPGIAFTTPQMPTRSTLMSLITTPAMIDPPFCDWCVNVTGQEITNNITGILSMLERFGCTEQVNEINKYLASMNSDFLSSLQTNALYFTYMGCAVIAVAYLQMVCWHTAAYNQSQRIRTQLLRSIMRQDIGWFDTHDVGELNTRLVDDVDQIERGIGDKLALLCQYLAAFVAGYVIGFVYGWELTLVIMSVSPILAIAGGLMAMSLSNMTKQELTAYAKAGAVAEEVLSAIRTVVAFGGQEKEALRYASNLDDACKVGMKKGLANGLGMGAVFLVIFGSYALGFWYGSQLTLTDPQNYSAGTMLIVFFSVLMGTFSIGASSPNIQDFANARGAAYVVYGIIDQVPPIDSSSEAGLKPEKMTGNIEFKDVVFRYPSRPEVEVLNGLSLKVNVGQTVALVGSSGCGKSTSIQLLQRFYDTLSGQVLIDGIDIKDYNIKWLRRNIGVVSQEPVLFGLTIAENIRFGRYDATQEDIEAAAKNANAHDFISQLPLKYETLVGERGAQLSGGQKQRIAIARALVRDPKILLLDEATSALDTESEGIVQAALDKAREGRTTIVIAHRLSTIQTADIIAGVVKGVVVEQGTHQELMLKAGVYYTLVTNQKQMQEEGEDDDDGLYANEKLLLKRTISAGAPREVDRQRSMSVISKKSLKVEKEEKLPPAQMTRIMKLNAPEWHLILIGCLAAVVMGCVQPAFAIIFASLLGVFSEDDPAVQEQQFNLYSGLFAALGGVSFVAMFISSWMLSRSGEFLTMRLRDMTFRAVLRQEISYFDDHQNNTGALCSRLSSDASAVKGATGSRLSTLIQAFGSIGLGIVIGFIYSWQLTLVVLAFAPFMLLTGFVEMRIMQGTRGERNKKMEEGAKIAVESIENIRTVATLTQEDKLYANYCDLIAIPYDTNRRKSHLTGLLFGFSQACVFFANAAAFYYGGWLVLNAGLSYENMFKVFSAILFGAMAAGQASSFAPDYGKAKIAAARLFALFDRVPPIDSYSEAGDKLTDVIGAVEFRGVQFHYPSRPDIQVLKGLDITVEPGKKVALVGSSGCGKSTAVQLIERFYDPLGGQVLIDGHPIDSLHLQWLRRQLGIVSQEPILFDCSIRENIAYGDNFREVTMEEIIEAARMANIHNFIESLPQGYETNVGDKGAQLSGGQKQRVAIARALVRSPKILLLDEATSALDTESEKVVQEALERAQEGRTSIVIAHRLSTIQNSDCIIVIQSGKVTEIGTHSELLAKRGFYYKLNTRQTTAS